MFETPDKDPITENQNIHEKVSFSESILLQQYMINLVPNPANEQIRINGIDESSSRNIQLLDDKGVVIENNIQLHGDLYDISKLNPGVYIFEIEIEGFVISKKFVKI